MRSQRRARFVRKWFAEWKAEPPIYGRASMLLTHLIEFRPDEAWERVLVLVADAREESLGFVGAGPLEDILSLHGEAIIARVEALATTDPRFARCLAAVWGWNRFAPTVYARVRRAIEATSPPIHI